MKKLFSALMVCVLVGFFDFSPVMAVEAPSQQKAVSAEDAKKVREEVKKLGTLFGVEAKEQQASAQKTKQEQEPKTIAGVADKALDMLSQAVATISVTMEKVAPEVWKIMVRQQYAKAVMNCVVPIGLLLVLFIYMRLVGKYWKPEKEQKPNDVSEWELRMCLVRVIPVIMSCAAGLWFFNRLADSIVLLINPQFYAIRDLLQMIMNSGGM